MSNPNPPADPIAQVISEVKKDAPGGGIPLEVTLTTGQIYRGATPQEVLDQLVKAQTESTITIKQQRDRTKELEAQLEQAHAPKPSESDAAQQQKLTAYYETWAKDPTDATRGQLADLLGIPKDRVIEVLKNAITASTANSASDEFIARYPEFPSNPQTAQLMNEKLRQLFGGGIDAATADNLELAYNALRREGRIVPNTLAASGFTQPPQPLPILRGSSAPPNPNLLNDAEFRSLSLDKMKEVLERATAMLNR